MKPAKGPTVVETCGGADLPERDVVLGQAVPFDPERWSSLLPSTAWWPEEFDTCPVSGRWPRVDRRTVFGLARRADSAEGRRRLLVAALVWGCGTKARLVHRRARLFTRTTATDIDTRLATALQTLHERGAAAAYYAFNNDHWIPHLGPAFFTKVLYFAGHDTPTGTHRPLILDSVVSQALRSCKMTNARWPASGWTTPQYQRYLTIVHDIAHRNDVLPDQVESALFSRGKAVP
ncbi:hypothetical protein [Streptomyces xinghaiensis]|uniref:8-oxoguanine DNA glycosylase OGG fold protein n=1 Tax=Streptomyces xinghaiensis TaxID=1038928 RepID=UPI0034198888